MTKYFFILAFLLFSNTFANAETLPMVEREFRAAWIATVNNIDFPSKKNLTVEQQKAEIIRDLEIAKSLKLNAVIFQVRPMCDALYESKIEPWSEFLTGEMGKPQSFDPLKFITEEAHRRGILVHAWFNPYRALHPSAKTISPNHISKRRPDLVRKYGDFLWLDPGEAEVQVYSLSVVIDVVRRYDIDGVHFDDYFYPYPIQDKNGADIEFPDEQSWKKYKASGGKLARDDWRRKNVDDFIETVGREIKRVKPQILYGISPFGIWQPLPEKEITGLNARAKLYADARKWLQDGTVDYLAPQLYWETSRKNQSFPVLLDWWKSQNSKSRHIWVGIAPYRIGSNPNFTTEEILNQIKLTKNSSETLGAIHYSFKSLRNDIGKIQNALRENVYQKDALIPISKWIKTPEISAPKVKITRDTKFVRANWSERGKQKAFRFVVYAKDKNGWTYSILPAAQTSITLSADRKIEKIIVKSVDRLGNESR